MVGAHRPSMVHFGVPGSGCRNCGTTTAPRVNVIETAIFIIIVLTHCSTRSQNYGIALLLQIELNIDYSPFAAISGVSDTFILN